MNIQGVNPATASQTSFRQSNPRLESLDKQITNLQKSIQEVHANEKLDAKTKMEKVKEYQDQIQMIQQEKAQIQAEERQSKLKSSENNQPTFTQDSKAGKNVVNDDVQNAFTKMDSAKRIANEIGVVREQAKGELRIAESKSFLRRPESTPAAARKARDKLAGIDRNTMQKANGIVNEINDNLNNVSQEVSVNIAKDESESDKTKSGTGRMEPGQFLNEEG